MQESLANSVQFCSPGAARGSSFLWRVESLRGGERRLWSWGTAVVRQLGQEEEEEALAVRHLWGNLVILLQGRNAALLASLLLPCHSRWGQTCKEVRNSLV